MYIDDEWERLEGSPTPLGASWIETQQSYNFALYSKDATAVTLLLFGAQDLFNPLVEIPFRFPTHKTGRIWHSRVSKTTAGEARYYAYRLSGPVNPAQGQRFDAEKVILDPYARGVFFPPGFDRNAAIQPGSNIGRAPLGLLPARRAGQQSPSIAASRHGHDLVIYELHVKGFTRRDNSGVTEGARGTFAGVIEKIPYLKNLGVTAVELMPIHQFEPGGRNYWGYMTLNFFSANASYGSDGSAEGAFREFRDMVDKLHAAGIEVFLDVVYNHTAEMGAGGPTYSFRGIDNSSYYALSPGDLSQYMNYSGCGNDLRTAHPVTRRLVVDSLVYWATAGDVDGFRFDLASVFARNDDGSLNLDDPPVISEISSNSVLGGVRLIAEPWDGGGGGYLMGRQFPGLTWRQWNDHFRDAARSFTKGDPGVVPDLMTRLYGSTDLFHDTESDSYRRWQSINYVTSHDGLNMADLVSYTNDGQRSWNCGFQGVVGARADVAALRRRQVKNFCCLLMLSNGTPMFVAGDEFMNTQRGNANPYDQDNETTWLDWSLANANADIHRFFTLMIAFRKAHPSIGQSTGWGADVSWHGVSSDPDISRSSHSIAFHLRSADGDIYTMTSSYWEPLTFQIQAPGTWRRVVDTARESPADIVEEAAAKPIGQSSYTVAARSAVVLVSNERA